MGWNFDTARRRIDDLMSNVPEVKTEGFAEEYLPRFNMLAETARSKGLHFDSKPLFSLRNSEAVIVDGVHVYAKLVNYDDYRLSEGVETEKSHARALNFLHIHYSACDRVVENCGAQRVDFHDGRMHAVVIEPLGANNEGVRVAKAILLAEQLKSLSASAVQHFRDNDFGSEYRFGIDTGVCVATNNGISAEQEPLFLGSAANHAAKLAEGSQTGIYLSDRAEAALKQISVSSARNQFEKFVDERPTYRLDENVLPEVLRAASSSTSAVDDLLESWRSDIRSGISGFASSPAEFVFHAHRLPLSNIDYQDLMPSNSIRMGMISIFGDLDGYTKYIDGSMKNRQKISNAIRNLHVIRGEWANVIQKDFAGRKVRFIGDCIHGVLADGEGTTTDNAETIRQAIHCAGGLRSSFGICQGLLPDAHQLGLAIGFEFGPTPITRLGIRGERSVRVASSIARTMSEAEQQRCNGVETAIGPVAFETASQAARALFSVDRKTANLDYDSAYLGVPAAVSAPALATKSDNSFRAHSEDDPWSRQ